MLRCAGSPHDNAENRDTREALERSTPGRGFPYIEVPVTKNDDPKIIPLPTSAVEELRELPSFGKSDYLFPAKPTHRRSDPSQFKKPYRWDVREAFVEACAK